MSSDQQMWDRILHKLGGMMMHAPEDGHQYHRRSDICDGINGSLHRRRSSSLDLQFPAQLEPLKGCALTSSSSSAPSSPGHNRSKSIQFDSTVSVVTIPSHTSYSRDLKKHLWSTNYETSENAKRNRREFAAEHYDWKQCVEEDEMYFDRCSSEYIHPIHLSRYMMDE